MSDFTKLHRLERVDALNGASTKARAVWSLVHHALDRRGRMNLGGAEWMSVLVRRLGVDSKERQWFYAALRELQGLGLIRVVGDVFVLTGHAGARPGDDDSTGSAPPAITDLPSTSDGPSTDLRTTSDQPKSDLLETFERPSTNLRSGTSENHSTSDTRARVQNREEEKREEGEETRARVRTPPPPIHAPHIEAFERSLRPPSADDAAVVELVSRTRREAGGAPFVPVTWHDRTTVSRLAEWARSPEIGLDQLAVALAAFWAAKGPSARLSWLADEDPGRYLAAAPAQRRRGPLPARTHAEFERIAATSASEGRNAF